MLLWPPVYPLGRFPSLRYVETEDQGSRGPPPEQQNVKAVSVRHCAATTAPRSCYPSCYAEQGHKDNVRSSAVGKQLKQKKSNSQAQHHLPGLDLFWDNFFVRVQLTSLLLISPGLCMIIRLHQSSSLYIVLLSLSVVAFRPSAFAVRCVPCRRRMRSLGLRSPAGYSL